MPYGSSRPVPKRRLALVSHSIRVGSVEGPRALTEFDVTHFYFKEDIGDISEGERGPELVRVRSHWELYRRLKSGRFDLIQGGEPYYFPANGWICLVVYLLFVFGGVPYFFPFFENRDPYQKFSVRVLGLNVSMPLVFIYVLWAKVYTRSAFLVLAVNGAAKELALRLGASPGRVVRYGWGGWGVDLQRFRPDPAAKPQTRPIVMFAGRIDHQKGIDTLLEAFLVVQQETGNSTDLWIVGSGKELGWAHRFVEEQQMGEYVRFIAFVERRDLPQIFHCASVFVSLSRTTKRWAEQMGFAVQEALACGVPVVATWSGGLPDYLEHGYGCLLVPENNPRAAARAIRTILGNSTAMGVQARQWAEIKFDMHAHVERSQQLIQDAFLEFGR